ncbi:uncharacterized protein EI97DRAFT_437558 [Westerdykella ornata]|uniref:Interferon-related developmental regulator N-terminal domain-containing protein n=1 Tax=Westerdykella ornata TaxID=318751 RepID=A0A6A6J6E8_WESOR|nr:uncharacterized protein EI97DRAFT_437558 [Westerdykella ornata]KAF2271777.1 hypothetical protein EI97DRAFT_437558 [Westerdykella ornata]
MHDLRRQALESGKTVSRKARSRMASGASSRAGSAVNSPGASRAASRNASRANSDDEEYLSDETNWSTNSINGVLNGNGDDAEVPADAWKTELNTRIEQIVNLKRSTTEGRAESLNAFAHILMLRYARDQIENRMSELLPSILRSIRQETTLHETICALKALCVVIVTLDSDDIYDKVADVLRRTISDSELSAIKVGAIHALSTAAFFGGTSEEEMEDIMSFFLEIVESDGLAVGAHDEASVVTAALQGWGLLATEIEDMEEATENAIEAFVDQLESADAGVQIAAGENIALLYEKSYTPLEADEDVDEADLDSEDEDQPNHGDRMVRRYTVWRRQDQLLHTLDELATIHGRGISKKDKKSLHSSFSDIRNSVEKPTRGPRYSTALDQETGRAYGGGRIKFKVNRNVEVRIDKWWKLQRLDALRRVLQGGVPQHHSENDVVSRCLPFSVAGKH